MFSASLSLAQRTPLGRGKNIRVYLLSRGGEEMKKRMVVPKTPVFYTECIRMMRRVHQEPLYGTARPFRTPGGHLRYRMLHRQKGERPCLRRIPQTARKEEKPICQKRKCHSKKRSPECKDDKNSVLPTLLKIFSA